MSISWLVSVFDSSLGFFGFFPGEVASLPAGVEADCWAASDPVESVQASARLSKNFVADAAELVEKARKRAKRYLVWAI